MVWFAVVIPLWLTAGTPRGRWQNVQRIHTAFPQRSFFFILITSVRKEQTSSTRPNRTREKEQAIAYLVDARKQVFTQVSRNCRDGYWNADQFDAWVFLNNAIKHLQTTSTQD